MFRGNRRRDNGGGSVSRAAQQFLTPEAREFTRKVGARAAEAARDLGAQALQAAGEARERRQQRKPAEGPPPASAAPDAGYRSSHAIDPPKAKEPTIHVEPSGLRVETKPLEWPPKDRDAERRVLLLYLAGYYDRRREAFAKQRRELERQLEKETSNRTASRSMYRNMMVASLAIGGLFVLLGLTGSGTTNLGFGCLAIAGLLFLAMIGSSTATVETLRVDELPSPQQLEQLYDRINFADVEVLWSGAQRMLALDKAGGQENQIGPYLNFPNIDETADAFWGAQSGSDGKHRFTPRSVYYLSFHVDQLITYEGATDLIKGVPIYHKLREFSYQDITSVARTTRTKSFMRLATRAPVDAMGADQAKPLIDTDTEQKLVTTQEVVLLNLLNGESVSIVLNDSYLTNAESDTKLPQNASDEVVELIRSLVRDKKRHALNVPGSAPGAPVGSAAF